jgi:exoribonuclease R
MNINMNMNININRLDLTNNTKIKIYSIDPPNCTDADDAFSIWVEDDNIHLMIFIADPTSYIEPHSELFNKILLNAQSIYTIGKEPIHLYPLDIIEKTSLTHGIREVIAVHTILIPVLSTNNMFNIKSSQIEYCTINCENHNRYTYDTAANNIFNDKTLLLGMNIAQNFWNKRPFSNNNDFIFGDFNLVVPYIEDNEIVLKKDSRKVLAMKSMIAEFAIHANSIFAKALFENDANVFLRTLVINSSSSSYNNLSQNEMLHKIIEDNISASYSTDILSHDMVGKDLYTHATSPLRRASDCIVHYLLKAKYLNIESPFTKDQLTIIAHNLTIKAKQIKNAQFNDIKLNVFKWMAQEFKSRLNTIKLKVKVTGYHAPFLNLIITSIDNMDINISYTLKRQNISNINKDIYEISISKINLNNKFDEGTLPELDILY